MYALPICLALFAEARGELLARIDGLGEISGYLLGAMYAGTLLLCLLAGILSGSLLTFSKHGKLLGAAGICIFLILSVPLGIQPAKTSTGALLCLIPILLADAKRSFEGKEEESLAVFLFPFFLAFFLFVRFIPGSEKPLDWTPFLRVCESIVIRGDRFIDGLGLGRQDFGEAAVGFSGHGGLFANLRRSNREVMDIYGNSFYLGATYLKGKVFSEFEDGGWHVPEDGEVLDPAFDTLEMLCAVRATYPDHVTEVCRFFNGSVYLRGFRTEYVFTPEKPLMDAKLLPGLRTRGENLLFDRKKGFGFEYKTSYYVLNRGGEELVRYLRPYDAALWDEVSHEKEGYLGKTYSYEELLSYREKIKARYGSAPELSEEIRDLILEIAGEEAAPYDRMKNIERFLNAGAYSPEVEGYEETLSAEAFLRKFLLEKTEGYCNYYATAFVLMARSLGMPARLVQGFRIPRSDYRGVVVFSSYAHAWPEVYFEGAGWIRFEPTPGFADGYDWGERLLSPEEYDALALAGGFVDGTGIEHHGEEDSVYDRDAEEEARARELERERLRREAALRQRRAAVTLILIVFGSLLLVVTAFICFRLARRYLRLQKADDRECARILCGRCFAVLRSLDLAPMQGETLSEFGKRIRPVCGLRKLCFIETSEALLYGRSEDLKFDEKALMEEHYELKKLLRGRKKLRNRLRYFGEMIRE